MTLKETVRGTSRWPVVKTSWCRKGSVPSLEDPTWSHQPCSVAAGHAASLSPKLQLLTDAGSHSYKEKQAMRKVDHRKLCCSNRLRGKVVKKIPRKNKMDWSNDDLMSRAILFKYQEIITKLSWQSSGRCHDSPVLNCVGNNDCYFTFLELNPLIMCKKQKWFKSPLKLQGLNPVVFVIFIGPLNSCGHMLYFLVLLIWIINNGWVLSYIGKSTRP